MEIINKIKNSSSANFLNRAKKELIDELYESTSFLPSNYGNAIRYWYIKNDIYDIQKCKCCDKEPNFHGIAKGYALYCSTKCRNLDTSTRHEFNKEIKKSLDSDRLKKDQENFVKCEICGSAIKLLKNHLRNSHKDWSFDRYKEEFPNSSTIAKSTSKLNSENNKGDKNIFSKVNSTEKERKERSIFSLEYWKVRYPEKTEEELVEMRNIELKDKLKDRLLPSQVEYWIRKGFTEEDSTEKVKERQRTFSLKRCIEKYGEDEGLKVFKERQRKWSKSLFDNFEEYGDGRSIQSKWASDIIDYLCNSLKIKRPKKEKWISSKDRELKFSYDFTYRNKIIEFHGDFWHANPLFYGEDFIIPRCNIKASEKWKIDEAKFKLAESHGYEILVVWEFDFKEDSKKIIDKCLKFLNS
jgi:transcriptional regulator CtsR